NRIAGDFVGNRDRVRTQAPMRPPQREDGGGSETVKNPADEDYATDKFGKFSRGNQDARPYSERSNSGSRRLKSRVNFGKLFEKKIVVGHGIENAGRGEHYAIRRTECGNQDSERDDFAGPRAKHHANSGRRDGIAGGRRDRSQRNEIGAYGRNIQHHQ